MTIIGHESSSDLANFNNERQGTKHNNENKELIDLSEKLKAVSAYALMVIQITSLTK